MKSFALAGLVALVGSLSKPATTTLTVPIHTNLYTTPQSSRVLVHVDKPAGREYRLRILAQNGQVVHVGKGLVSQKNNWHLLDLDALPDGLYAVEVQTTQGRTLRKEWVQLSTDLGWDTPGKRQATIQKF